MTVKACFACCAVLFLSSFRVASSVHLQEGASDSSACPERCSPCEKAVDKALRFIASTQKQDGTWAASKWNQEPAALVTPAVTAFNALALFSAGSTTRSGAHRTGLAKAKEAAAKLLEEYLGYTLQSAEDLIKRPSLLPGYVRYQVPLLALCLAHVQAADPKERLKKLLQKTRDWLVKDQREDGGWSYGPKGFPAKFMDMAITFQTHHVVLALFALHHVGVEVEEGVFEKARKFYLSPALQSDEGAFVYRAATPELFRKDEAELDRKYFAGRTLAGLLPMRLLGLSKTERFGKALGFSRKHLSDIDLCECGPAYPLLAGAWSCFSCGDEKLWEEYRVRFRDRILRSQGEDGSIRMTPREAARAAIDPSSDPVYTTAQYVVILQIHKGHLLFHKFKPMPQAGK